MRRPLVVCAPRHDDPRRGAADDRGRGDVRRRRARRAWARDPDRPRPAHPRGGRGHVRRRSRRGGHDGAGRDGVGRPYRGARAAGHARPRDPPPARRLGDRPGPRRRRGRRPGGRRGAHARFTCARRSRGRSASTPSRTRRASCARRSSRCTARGPTRCASPPCTRWSSTRSPGGSSTSPIADVGPLDVPFAWLALGSVARREATPGSDVESADRLAGRAPRTGARRARAGDQPPRRGRAASPAACAPTSRAPRRPTRCSSARWPPGSARRAAGSRTRRRSRR